MKIEFSFGNFLPAKNNFVGWLKFYVRFGAKFFTFFTLVQKGVTEKQKKSGFD
jgi:hypothetical protein